MLIPLDEVIASLPESEQEAIKARSAELIAEEMSLRDLRKALGMTQATMAKKLGTGQEAVSKIEKRSDMKVSTLVETIGALGGQLELIARFPDRTYRLEGLGLAPTMVAAAHPSASRTRP